MAKDYRYADAVRLLGGADAAVEKIDLLLSIGTLGLWDVIDAKQQFMQVGNTLLGRWREWRTGREWHSRTERMEAAHTILVITAFFGPWRSNRCSCSCSRCMTPTGTR
ncbi:NACHT N-terminal helical domain 7-containing protein [Nonomuraea sp. NPDC003201]